MEISSYTLSRDNEGEKFEYGIKLMPHRTLDKFTDSMVISKEKSVVNKDIYNICFKRRQGVKVVLNNFTLNEECFKQYIDFLINFNKSFDSIDENIESEFIINNGDKIIISSLNKDYIKISSEKVGNSSLNKVFFTLFKTELQAYIKVLKSIYSKEETVSSLGYQMSYLINPLSKAERDSLYLEALYVFIDNALENRNKYAFDMLSREVQRILNC